ncbi:MAG TPA: DUF3850 domain-containing protein [Drouetiella sp.]
MCVHLLKSDPIPFQDVWSGDKLCELRTNDRNFEKGQWVQMFETDINRQVFTGRMISGLISHVQRGYGLQLDMVALSLKEISRYRTPIPRQFYVTFHQVNQDSVFVSKKQAQKELQIV